MAEDQPPDSSKTQKWIDSLAQRSAGLPSPKQSSPDAPPAGETSRLWQLAGLGIEFGGTFVLFLLIGRWIDARMGWSFAATLIMMALALIGNLYLLIKQTSNMK